MKLRQIIMLITSLIVMDMNVVNAQQLSSHRWQDRVLLIFTDDAGNNLYKRQVETLSNNKEGLVERKLVIYQVLPDKWKKGLDTNSWKKSNNSFGDISRSQDPFEVILVGLDGGVKFSKTSILSIEELFGVIDGMPMRREEIRKKNDGK